MIKFFRRFRQNLLSQGKTGRPASQTGRYLKYATGEIFLVVIGILIAISINNWNEARKQAIIEIEYLQRLRSDLANDTAYYHRRIIYADKILADHKKAIEISYTEIANPLDFHQSFKFLEYSSEALSIRNITYNEMHNAGQINIIRNDKIKTEILEFYRQVDLVAKHFEEINNTSIDFMMDFFIQSKALKHIWSYGKETSVYTTEMLDESYDWQWINDPKSESFKSFQSSLVFYKNKQMIFKGYFEDLLKKSTFLLKEIETELRSRSIEVSVPNIEPVFVME